MYLYQMVATTVIYQNSARVAMGGAEGGGALIYSSLRNFYYGTVASVHLGACLPICVVPGVVVGVCLRAFIVDVAAAAAVVVVGAGVAARNEGQRKYTTYDVVERHRTRRGSGVACGGGGGPGKK